MFVSPHVTCVDQIAGPCKYRVNKTHTQFASTFTLYITATVLLYVMQYAICYSLA